MSGSSELFERPTTGAPPAPATPMAFTAAFEHWGLQREMLTRTDSEPRPIGSTPT